MRVIKFRGRVIDSDKRDGGRIVFGSLVDHGESKHCPRYWIYPLEGDRNFPVAPDSIAQLVGYDKDGKEVYEGDTLIDSEGYEYLVSLQGMVLLQPLKKDGYVAHLPADLRTMLLDVAKRFTPLTLKED